MAPIIHLVRHAEGLHNETGNWDLPDPPLTSAGQQQARDLGSNSFEICCRVTHLVASPSERTIVTCKLAFGDVIRVRDVPLIIHPLFQEVQEYGCNVPEMPDVIRRRHGSDFVDLQYLDDTGSYRNRGQGSRYRDERSAVTTRAQDARNWLRQLVQQHGENAEVVVVAHRAFNMYLAQDFRLFWENAALHSYEFANWQGTESTDPEAGLVYVRPVDVSARGQPPLLPPQVPQARRAPRPPQTAQPPQTPQPPLAPNPPGASQGRANGNPAPAKPPGPTAIGMARFPLMPLIAATGLPQPPPPPFDIVVKPARFTSRMKQRARQMLRFRHDFPGDDSLFTPLALAQAAAVCRRFAMCGEGGQGARDEEPGEDRWPAGWSPRSRSQRRAIAGFMNNWNRCFR